jgi:Tfp pilus assembly protein PilV
MAGISLAEVVVSMGLLGMSIGGIINGYVYATRQAEWSAYSLAAHSLAVQRLEQARAAKWDPQAYPSVDRVIQANFPVVSAVLDVPMSGTNCVIATITTTVSTVSVNPPARMIRVDCRWPFMNRGWFTNTIVSYRAPDQ